MYKEKNCDKFFFGENSIFFKKGLKEKRKFGRKKLWKRLFDDQKVFG